jgi:mannose-6-phosphate isomerase-like protein (cupin superfamily)
MADKGYTMDHVDRDRRDIATMHGGSGVVSIKHFDFAGATQPATLLHLRLSPGAAEGAHRHDFDEPVEGAYDEYYFIMAGSGVLTVDDQAIAVISGDHVHVHMGATRSLANMDSEPLEVMLTVIAR